MPADRDALLEISAAIHSTRDLETLEKHLLEIVSRTLYADRGAILLLGESGEQIASVCGWDAREGENRITAALCVPLVVFQQIRGVLYLDSTDPQARFEPEQLAWLSAIGGIAALVLEDVRRIEWLEGENRRLRAEIAVAHEMVGAGPAIREMERFIARAAPTDS